MIEKNFDIPFIADLAQKEKQIQQNYRPIIAVHKWFARRPGTLFRGLLLSEFSSIPLREAFYTAHDLHGIKVADPFMGGGTPLLEANRIGCDIVGFDINPMSYWIVKQEVEHLDLMAYESTAKNLVQELEKKIGHLYHTQCVKCSNKQAIVKYFLWIKQHKCFKCKKNIDLFPGYLVASNTRHPMNVFVCPVCGKLTEVNDRKIPGKCHYCGEYLPTKGIAIRNRCKCPYCMADNVFPNPELGPPPHRLFAIEYHCQACKNGHVGRFFKAPDMYDLEKIVDSKKNFDEIVPVFVPDDKIPSGDETNRLLRWGYTYYHEMFNFRQKLGLELSAHIIAGVASEQVRNALATNLSDLLRYQNMLCRYDTMALKSLDIFSVHGFPVGLIQCESNLMGIMDPHQKICVGSGGWKNIIEKFRKAKSYCYSPFEIKHHGLRKEFVPIRGEWIGDQFNGNSSKGHREVRLHCMDAAQADLPECSLDAVFTDPPYFSNVQYAELMDFCYVWLKRLIGEGVPAFQNPSTRNKQELTGNEDMGRGLAHFTEGLSLVFQRMALALKMGAPLVFTYHHNLLEAYLPVAVAVLDSGLTCSASLPCPAEMGASIHINGTGSSIVDTVFVCRATGNVSKKSLPSTIEGVVTLVQEDLTALRKGGIKPTLGDTRCITYGHLIRLAIWDLRTNWDKTRRTTEKIRVVEDRLKGFGPWTSIEKHFSSINLPDSPLPQFASR